MSSLSDQETGNEPDKTYGSKLQMTIQREMILSFTTCEKLNTYLLKDNNKKNFPQQLISE